MRRPAGGGPDPVNAQRSRRVRERIADARDWRTLLREASKPRGWIPGEEDGDRPPK